MTTFAYNRDIPFATNDPSADQPNMLINTNNIDSLIAVDHVSFKLPDGGFHTVIHQKPFSTVTTNPPNNNPPSLPPTSGGNGEIITVQLKPVTGGNSDECLFFQSGGGRWTQLTNVLTGAGNQASASAFGYCPLPGGIILQWGEITKASNSEALLFITNNIDFPNNCFNVQLTGHSTLIASSGSILLQARSLTKTGFVMDTGDRYNNGSTFWWIAIGN
jgi:tail fiber protein gp53